MEIESSLPHPLYSLPTECLKAEMNFLNNPIRIRKKYFKKNFQFCELQCAFNIIICKPKKYYMPKCKFHIKSTMYHQTIPKCNVIIGVPIKEARTEKKKQIKWILQQNDVRLYAVVYLLQLYIYIYC